MWPEKRYFIQHISRYWNWAHSMPAEAAEVLDQLKEKGQLEVLKGRLEQITANGRFEVAYRTNGRTARLAADAVINCIGSESNFQKLDSALVRNLFAAGSIRSDALTSVDACQRQRSRTKCEVTGLIYTLGTAMRGPLERPIPE